MSLGAVLEGEGTALRGQRSREFGACARARVCARDGRDGGACVTLDATKQKAWKEAGADLRGMQLEDLEGVLASEPEPALDPRP